MSLWLRIANRLILENTTHYVDAEDRQRQLIETSSGNMEAWIVRSIRQAKNRAALYVLKFPGTGGRAERGGSHPCEVLSPNDYEVWTINPPGYGGSQGVACITNISEVSQKSWQAIATHASETPIVVVGNSLGSMYALHVAARFPVAGVFLRNPTPLTEMILGRYSWWNFGLFTRKVCAQIPPDVRVLPNAGQATAPLFMVTSTHDRLVPPRYQQMLADAYAGNVTVFEIENADHHTPIPEDQIPAYTAALEDWRKELRLDC